MVEGVGLEPPRGEGDLLLELLRFLSLPGLGLRLLLLLRLDLTFFLEGEGLLELLFSLDGEEPSVGPLGFSAAELSCAGMSLLMS